MEKTPLEYFCEISAIPRGSGNTKAISDYCVKFAQKHKLEYVQDRYNNVIIKKPAYKGYENYEPVIIQGHLDMVCDKVSGAEFDFEKDPLKLKTDGDFIFAENTTLGGDDGIAAAYMLALLASADIPHPKIEAVFTVDEEIGMDGAKEIDLSGIEGHKMLNIDSEEEGVFTAGCAGGMNVFAELPVHFVKNENPVYKISISGLIGGHSGVEINKERANAIVLAARLLDRINNNIALCGFSCGVKHNVIPDNSVILVSCDDFDVLKEKVKKFESMIKKEYSASDPDIRIDTERADMIDKAVSAEGLSKIIAFLMNAPCGVQNMSADIENLVETSVNMATAELSDKFKVCFSIRSSQKSRRFYMYEKISALAEILGADIIKGGEYPEWEFRRSSELRELMEQVYEKQYRHKPKTEIIHAGLECGILSEKIPDFDAVSFGPDIYDIHTPKERMSISSAERVWEFIKAVLKEWNFMK